MNKIDFVAIGYGDLEFPVLKEMAEAFYHKGRLIIAKSDYDLDNAFLELIGRDPGVSQGVASQS